MTMMAMMLLPTRRRGGVVVVTSSFNTCVMHRRLLSQHNNKRRYHPHESGPSVLIMDDTTGSSTSSSNNHQHLHDPLTNGGTIVGLWCFHRHGDRAPNRYLGPPQYLSAEATHWTSRIPTLADAHDQLSKYFPPLIHPNQNSGVYLDVTRNPFGYLTYRGMDQMREVGQKFRRRYERFGFQCERGSGATSTAAATTTDADATNSSTSRDDENSQQYSFLDHWDVKAYSTNYLRTVMSVQCFLDGLIGKYPQPNHSSDDGNNNSNNCKRQIYAGGGLKRYYMDIGEYERCVHLDRPTWTTSADMTRTNAMSTDDTADTAGDDNYQIPVQVRDKDIDTLNMFDKYPEMMNGLVKDVIATERFQRIDLSAKPLADELSTYLPGLRGAPQAFGGTPSQINWIHANDHFVCRKAHSIPLSADFSDNMEGNHHRHHHHWDERKEENEQIENKLASLAVPVCSHLAWRFREWYSCPRLLSAIAGPPCREVLNGMLEVANHLGPNDRRPFVLYSCHDVTLLALLYAIGTDFLVSGEDCGGAQMQNGGGDGEETHSNMTAGTVRKGTTRCSWRWWPAYSSTIAFELVKLDHEQQSAWELYDQYVIRVVLNGDAIRLIPRMSIEDEGILREQSLSSRQVFGETTTGGKCKMMRLSDFDQVIRVFEEAGDHVVSSIFSDDSSCSTGKIGVEGG